MGENLKYEKAKTLFGKMKKKEQKVEPKIITNQLTLISKDINSEDISKIAAAQDMLNFMLNLSSLEVETQIIKYLNGNISHEIFICFVKAYARKMTQIIESKGNLNEVLQIWKNQDESTLEPILEEVCVHYLSKDHSKKFLMNIVVPYIMSIETDVDIRNIMIKLAFWLLTVVHISDLTLKEYEQFSQAVYNKYFTTISQLRDQAYPNWQQLWIFIVRFCEKKIHHSMDLTNKLLRIVEFAFRNSDHLQRIRGYDCWKELIDNASLDMKYICSPKQIKLLITPLKAKFSKQEIVICKRFEVFTYLLQKLQQQSVLCLSEYLAFSFGPLGDDKDASKSGQCKNVPSLWLKSTKVLMEIIGHSHGKDCISGDDVIKLSQPVITPNNFHMYYKLIIHSVVESCLLLKDADLGRQRDQVISCMWKSIFSLSISSSEVHQPLYFQLVSSIMENYIKDIGINTYFEDLLVNIISSLLSFEKDFVHETVQCLLPYILQVLLATNLPFHQVEKLTIILSHCFTKITLLEKKLSMVQEIMVCFTSSSKEINMNVGLIWICLVDELVSDFSADVIEKFNQFEEFFIWPAHHLHLLDEQTNKLILLPWTKLYRKITNDEDSNKLGVLKKLEGIFKTNPFLSRNIISLLSVMAQFQTKYSKDFVMRLLEVNYSILQKPNLTQVEEYKACAIVLQYLDSSLECYSTEKSPEFVKLLCKCIIAILSHKEFKILESFPDFLKAIPEDMRFIFGENLCKFLTDIFNDLKQEKVSSKKYPRKEIQKVLTAFEHESQADDKKMFVIPAGRSARIAHLAKNSPKSPKKQVVSPIALRLFGKDPETLSPLKVRGSQLNNNPTSKKKKAANVIDTRSIFSAPILEENTCDFVAIGTEVRFLPEKLNEHQKEVMKKRREDIPALYEDLTQSLSNSQDLFSVNFNTKLCESEKLGSEHIKPLAIEEDDETIDTMRKGQFSSNSENTHKSEDLFSSSSNFYSKKTKLLDQELDGASVSPIFQNIIMKPTNEDSKGRKSSDSFDTSEDDATSKNSLVEEQRKRKMEKELLKLKMDVVGAHDFVSVVRRTRPKEKKEQTTKPKGRKSMLSGDKSPAKDDHSRRKSIGVIEEIKDNNIEEHNEALKEIKIVESKKETMKEFTILTNAKAKENDLVSKSNKSKRQVDSIGQQMSNKIIKNIGVPDKKKLKGTKNPGRTTETDNTHPAIAETPKSTQKHSVKLEEHQPVGFDEKQKAKESKSQDSEMKIKTKMRGKRKNLGLESEDIIESSQESFSDVTLLNSSKKRKTSIFEGKAFEGPNTTKTNILCCKMNPENLGNHNDKQSLTVVINEPDISENFKKSLAETIENEEQVASDTTQDTTISRDTSLDTTQTQDSLQDISLSSSKISKKTIVVQQQDTLTQDTLTQVTQETPTQVELDMLSEDINPTVLYLDLPKKPDLTESEQMMCRMDTMSICTDLEVFRSSDQATHHQSLEEVELQARSPTKSENKDALFDTPNMNSIPSSPVTLLTPTKTTELLNSTLDISPITSEPCSYSSDENSSEIPVPKLLVFESGKLDELVESNKENNVNYSKFEGVIEKNDNDIFDEEMSGKTSPKDVEDENIAICVDNDKRTIKFDNECENDAVLKECRNIIIENGRLANNDISSSENVTSDSSSTPNSGENISETDNGDSEQSSESLLPKSIQSSLPKEPINIQERSSRLIHMISRNSPVPNSSKFSKRRCGSGLSPSTGRIKRLMHSLQAKPSVEKIEEVGEEDILTFSREIPSPLAVPRNSILKRKLSDLGDPDSISPVAKRKRVNFSDPCLTSRKVFIKEDYLTPGMEAKRLFDPNLDNNTGEDNFQNIFFDLLDNIVNTESDNIETEPSLEIVNAHLLKKDKPIYPKLIDCKDDVMLILKKVTSPLFINTLMNKLKSKRIKTIGDLAMLSETEINRLPFKVPVVANVYRALDNFYKKNYEKDEANQAQPVTNGLVDEKKDIVIKDDSTKIAAGRRVDVTGRLEEILRKAVSQNINLEELILRLFSSLENERMLKILKECNIPLKEILSQYDQQLVMKYSFENFDTFKLLDLLQNSVDNGRFLLAVEQFCSNKIALKDIIKNFSINDLRQALNDVVENKIFNREDLIQNCLVSLIATPKDIQPYLKSLSMVELGDILIEKLPHEDSDHFLTNISKAYVNGDKQSLTVQLCQKDLLTSKDIVTCFKNCLSTKNENEQDDIMVEMFKFISGKLNIEKLLSLHVDFLQRIPSILSSKDK